MVPNSNHGVCSRCGRVDVRVVDAEALSERAGCNQNCKTYLSKTFYAGLCETCIRDIQELVHRSDELGMPKTPEALQPGIHYTIENGLLVFTELYHVMKGYCCRNGCKNCAYGFLRRG